MEIKWKRNPEEKFFTFAEREQELFKDFNGARAKSASYKIKDMNLAAEEIKNAIKNNLPIRIVGDYDADGITSTSNLLLGLRALNASDVCYRIPKRIEEGYGFSLNIWEEINENTKTPGLLITVDNGIAAIEPIKKAKEAGWRVLVLDHHLPQLDEKDNKILPEADVIIDPNAIENSANFYSYCGAGLIYKLFQTQFQLDENVMAKMVSLAMIGTFADCVNLIETVADYYVYDNYLICKEGLHSILQNNGRTTGLYCLLRALKLDYAITEDNILYMVAPTFNAAGRLNDDGPNKVIDLVTRDDNNFNECDKLALELIAYNTERKDLTEHAKPIYEKRIKDAKIENTYPLVYLAEENEIHPGLVGIVAGNIAEEYLTDAIVLSPREDGTLTGSCRAGRGSNIIKKLQKPEVVKTLIAFGGHAAAAGISLKAENLDAFIKAIQKGEKKPDDLYTRVYDFDIFPSQVEEELSLRNQYAPFGPGHSSPKYKFVDYELDEKFHKYYDIKGAKKRVIELFNSFANAIEFSGSGLDKFKELNFPRKVNLYGTIGTNTYQGVTKRQIVFQDMEAVCEIPEKPEDESPEMYMKDLVSSML